MYTKNKIYEKGRYAAILSRIPFSSKSDKKGDLFYLLLWRKFRGKSWPSHFHEEEEKVPFWTQHKKGGLVARNVLCTSTTSCVSLLVLRWLSAVLDSSVFLTFANPEFLLKLINNKFIKKFAIVTIVFWKCNCKLP